MFGLKGVFDNEALIKGLVIQDNKESVDDKAIVECDGFIQHEALLKKDFACVLTSGEVDNIDYIPPTEMPICPAGSEIDYEAPGYPWTAPTPSVEVTENSDDYILQSKLRWATGSMSSMNPGQTSYLSVLGNFGNTFWSLNTTGLTQGSITHSLTSGFNYGNKAKYKTSDDCAGSFYVEARDAFKTINRTISIGGSIYWIPIYLGDDYVGWAALNNTTLVPDLSTLTTDIPTNITLKSADAEYSYIMTGYTEANTLDSLQDIVYTLAYVSPYYDHHWYSLANYHQYVSWTNIEGYPDFSSIVALVEGAISLYCTKSGGTTPPDEPTTPAILTETISWSGLFPADPWFESDLYHGWYSQEYSHTYSGTGITDIKFYDVGQKCGLLQVCTYSGQTIQNQYEYRGETNPYTDSFTLTNTRGYVIKTYLVRGTTPTLLSEDDATETSVSIHGTGWEGEVDSAFFHTNNYDVVLEYYTEMSLYLFEGTSAVVTKTFDDIEEREGIPVAYLGNNYYGMYRAMRRSK